MIKGYDDYLIYEATGVADKCGYIVECIIKAIESGSLPPGKKMLSHSDLGKKLGLDKGYIERAYNILKKMKYLTSEPGRYTKVSPILPDRRLPYESPFEKDYFRLIHLFNPEVFISIGHLEYLSFGVKDLSPPVVLNQKSNWLRHAVSKLVAITVKDWRQPVDLDSHFFELAKRNLARTRRMKVEKENLAIGYERAITLTNIIRTMFKPGDRVVLSSHADLLVSDYLKSHGVKLSYVDCDEQGLPLQDIEKLIEEYRETDSPVVAVFSDPYRDSFNSNSNIHEVRAFLIDKTKEWGVGLLEEYSQDEYVKPPTDSLLEKLNCPSNHVVTFGYFRSLISEVRKIMVVLGTDDVVREFKVLQAMHPYGKGSVLRVIYQTKKEGTYLNATKNAAKQIEDWKVEVYGYAQESLIDWFRIVKSDVGSAFWLVVKGGQAVQFPKSLFDSLPVSKRYSSVSKEGMLRVKAIEICIGDGNTDFYKNFFPKMQESLRNSSFKINEIN